MNQTTTDQSADLSLNGVRIIDTFAEAFPTMATRVIVTAANSRWAEVAGTVMTGYATSVIACDAEAAIERRLSESETPDGRPGVSVLVFAFSAEALAKAVVGRVGQCVLTCPTTACFCGLPADASDKQVSIGGQLRYFGDTYQQSKKLGKRRFWRIPVMDGEFLCEDRFGILKGVAGGNLLIAGRTPTAALAAAEAAVSAIREVDNVILPFPGGIVRSGSKVGSRYKKLNASTNDAYCPTLRGVTELAIPPEVEAVYEIVIDGLAADDVQNAMRAGLHAACGVDDVALVTAGNYGGKLGPHHFYLKELI